MSGIPPELEAEMTPAVKAFVLSLLGQSIAAKKVTRHQRELVPTEQSLVGNLTSSSLNILPPSFCQPKMQQGVVTERYWQNRKRPQPFSCQSVAACDVFTIGNGNAYEYLIAAMEAKFANRGAPSLLPANPNCLAAAA